MTERQSMLCAYCGRVCTYPDDFPISIHAECIDCVRKRTAETEERENTWWRKFIRWLHGAKGTR